jgi:hypothetical protein
MKRNILLLLIIVLLAFNSNAQRNEVGIFGGGSYYLGDINPTKHFSFIKPAYGFVYRYNFTPNWTFKLNGFQGEVYSSDNEIEFNTERNLHFKSKITEVSTQIELNFFKYVTGSDDMIFSPFIFGGISIFKYNPQAEINGEWYYLQALGTEGQGTTVYPDRQPYNLVSFAIPFGVGFKLSLSENMSMAAEWGLRKTFTDYIDDVSTTYYDYNTLQEKNGNVAAYLSDPSISRWDGVANYQDRWTSSNAQRGDAKDKDVYMFIILNLTYKLRTTRKGLPKF